MAIRHTNAYLGEAWYDIYRFEGLFYYFDVAARRHLVRSFVDLDQFYARSFCGKKSERGVTATPAPGRRECAQCLRLYHHWSAAEGVNVPGLVLARAS
ncbi:MAG: hypothetical protein NTZ05_15250 [Chloroflexi bacterium]|nr:hypothetical protein [Chloroflexota bacterium]